MVHVGHGHAPAGPSPQAREGEAFEQLAANSTSTHLPAGRALARGRAPHPPTPPHPAHQEVVLVAQPLLKTSPKHGDLPVVAAASLGDTAQVSAGRWHCAWPFPTGLPWSEPRAPSLIGPGPPGALTGAQASGLGRSSPFSGRQSRASKYSHWSRGRNFLERAWRPHIRMLATIEALESGRGAHPGCEPPGPLSGVGHPLALTVTSASLPAPSAWATPTFSTSWAATAPSMAAMGLKTPALHRATVRTSASSSGSSHSSPAPSPSAPLRGSRAWARRTTSSASA